MIFKFVPWRKNKHDMMRMPVRQREREKQGSESDSDSPLWELSSNINVFDSLALVKRSLLSLPGFMLHFFPPGKGKHCGSASLSSQKGTGEENLANPICPSLLVKCAQGKTASEHCRHEI